MVARILRSLVLVAIIALLLASLPSVVRADAPSLSDDLREQTIYKLARQRRLQELSQVPGARFGQAPDTTQASIAEPLERGILQVGPGIHAAYAYIQPYQEPDDWEHANYCAAGAAIELLSHWDPLYAQVANVDELGLDIGIDPYLGAWISQITGPVNQRLNEYLGEELNWYTYGEARSLLDLRWIINVDLLQNAAPFITGLMTYGLPGWGPRNVGHIVAVYGYTKYPDGSEFVSYADTAGPLAGNEGYTLNAWELNSFWSAVSENTGQVW